ncbi:MAG TPA: diaminopimelate epimerase [Bryobacteraceae bacterium]|jgi:diaminopimelate epimerase|nr:diaminopimelate epimerase [Bryobacteraceae bacterium]
MKIPFTKAHGARNDFLLTWRGELPTDLNLAQAAQAICDRHTGIGADGWILMSPSEGTDVAIQLYNSDGSTSELSGNGTRCVAVYLLENGRAGDIVKIMTGAGLKELKLISRNGHKFVFEMNMGKARIDELRIMLPFGDKANDATILHVGNPQCAVFVNDFAYDWRAEGAWIERHPKFPNRTNVSFVRVVDEHTLEVRFWERGAGETMSSGTGATGAAAAAVARGLSKSPVEVQTPAGPLTLRWEHDDIYLAGPAEIVAGGDFYWDYFPK